MNKTAIKLLEYEKIKEILKGHCVSNQGAKLIEKLEPAFDIVAIKKWLEETTEAKKIISRGAGVPLHSLNGLDNIVVKLGKGSVLSPEELSVLSGFLKDGAKLKRLMKEREEIAPRVCSYALSISDLREVGEEIERCIVKGRVDDGASSELAKTRKKIAILEDRIKERLDRLIKSPSYRTYIQDPIVSQRGGRYVVPVKSEYRKSIEGNVLDSSSSGATLFIEPKDVAKYQDELNVLRIQEEKEVYRILATLTEMVDSYQKEISINIDTMAHYDFIFAKSKYSKAIGGNSVKINSDNYTKIVKGKHPLIGEDAVPLDFYIGGDYRALVITGPNTGGKTVALKTVGLLTMMVQSGLHVSVDPESDFGVYLNILVDIGDGQSIEQSLSTFSSHIKNIIGIIECTGPDTMVIIDEIGSGTDPQEGQGLATVILEEIYKRGATILGTTHYSKIKEFANVSPGFKNGCMEFDINTLKPKYRLRIGEAGESNAFSIALRLGMNKELIERAHYITYGEKREYSQIEEIKDIEGTEKDVETLHDHQLKQQRVKSLKETKTAFEKQKITAAFKVGDCVYISSMDRTGIVCDPENSKGEVGVMVMKKKIKINKKRLNLYIDGQELYPDNYDFDIVFESKENRKKRHILEKKHVRDMVIEHQ